MHAPWLRRIDRRSWTPRTLAVISCALALLAAQPALSVQPQAAREIPLVAAELSSKTPAFAPAKRETRSTMATRGNTELLRSAPHLRILATVEILKRLLISELQVAPCSQQLLIPALALEPLEFLQPLAVTLPLHSAKAPPPYFPLPPPEQRFVLEHFQLAPPTV